MSDLKNYTIAVAGTGYVGLSIATLLSQHHQVTAVDVIPEKVEKINNRISPIQDEYIEKYLPAFPIMKLEGTYLVWMDCSALGMTSAALEETLKTEAGIWINAGTMYGPGGEGYMRWNLACPRSILEEGLRRFRAFVEKSGVR